MASGPDITLLSSEPDKSKRTILFVITGVLLFGGAILAVALIVNARQQANDARSVTPATASDISHVTLSDLHLSAEENFIHQQVVYLDGKITNAGPQTVRQVSTRLIFHDVMGQVVLRDDQELLGAPQTLPPGQSQTFQIRFDRIPDSWNQAVPEVQIVSMRVQQP